MPRYLHLGDIPKNVRELHRNSEIDGMGKGRLIVTTHDWGGDQTDCTSHVVTIISKFFPKQIALFFTVISNMSILR